MSYYNTQNGRSGNSGRANEVVKIPDPRDVGRVIGQQGSVVKDIQAQSGARVSVNGDKLEVQISGDPSAVAHAKRLVCGIIGGEGTCLIRNVDEHAMGFITKKMGLMKLEGDMGVTIVLDRKDVRVTANDGSQQTADQAKEAILSQINDASRLETMTVRVPADKLRLLNGDAGLQQLKDAGLKVDCVKDDQGTAVALKGLKALVAEAKECVEALVGAGGARDFLPLLPDIFTGVQPQKMSDLMADIDEHIRHKLQVHVDFQPTSTKATITGSPDATSHAIEEFQKILSYYFPDNCFMMYLHPSSVEYMAGRDDSKLVRLQGRDLVASLDRDNSRLWLCGRPNAVNSAKTRVCRDHERWNQQNAEVYLDDDRAVGRIVGPRGQNIRRMQDESGATIVVEGTTVKIQGEDERSVQHAKRLVEQTVASFQKLLRLNS
ncbi:unnamed protein product [Vitrella brassicaformis CCMP3155]|uniref:K Homology domain-containing protein n=2 Tax=Vitrella brassicaformis TaxID=1169539 RepID=A0A0G4EIY6_VITBC|nr:unnamed protein product [Vitrella brassicaformis CCMP3155]|mmetsp:Transcript_20472/g.49812  ORF Transcript_20472/g.49812 Transcript_20472/m.49812 type:complete len:434 (+) Transcript_20472:64-1365(+)|eukprot:CEL95959.1 unnamed protein product [Vitrella brassicaformis CCMP3155]